MKQLQQENQSGILPIGQPVLYSEYSKECFFSGLASLEVSTNNGHEIYRAKSVKNEDKDFYQYPQSSNSTLSKLFTVETEPTGDMLVVFVADVSMNGHVQANLILHDDAWQKILLNKSQEVLRVEQFYLHILEKQLQIFA